MKEPDSAALIISLRDDEGMTRSTMTKILDGVMKTKIENAPGSELSNTSSSEVMSALECGDGRLEISYYPPGYITPEEFFHRIILAIKRLRSAAPQRKITLVFNSVEQLSYRFPLCTREPIFIPSIVQMLSAENVSSFFVAAVPEGSHGHDDTYGLETVAELMLRFERDSLSRDVYAASLAKEEDPRLDQGLTSGVSYAGFFERQVAKISVDRFAGGKAAGYTGWIDLRDMEEHPLANRVEQHRLCYLQPVSENVVL